MIVIGSRPRVGCGPELCFKSNGETNVLGDRSIRGSFGFLDVKGRGFDAVPNFVFKAMKKSMFFERGIFADILYFGTASDAKTYAVEG